MRTDEEILQLFARANPRPRTGAVAPPRDERHLEDLEERSLNMTDMKIPTERTAEADRKPSRGRLVAAVVGIAVVAAGFMLLPGPDEQEQTEVAAPADTPVQLAYRIIEARNAFDADALIDLLGSAQYEADPPGSAQEDETVDVTRSMQWFEAFDWRFVDPACEQTSDIAVACSYTITNRLTRHAGLEGEVDGTLYLLFESGALTSVSENTLLGTYSTRAFEPFILWVIANHSEAAEVMWHTSPGGVRPELTDESIRFFDEMLTEYTGTG